MMHVNAPPTCSTCGEEAGRNVRCSNPFHITGDPAWDTACVPPLRTMRTFTVYRRGDLSETHNEGTVNPPNEPQYEGVVFSDGTVALRWLTAFKSTSVWASLADAFGVHGHPEARYGTEIFWSDGGSE